jgi:hypothetical protein
MKTILFALLVALLTIAACYMTRERPAQSTHLFQDAAALDSAMTAQYNQKENSALEHE